MKENLLLLKDLLEPRKINSRNNVISISKIVCIDKLGDIVKKYNNAYHETIKMKIIDVNFAH